MKKLFISVLLIFLFSSNAKAQKLSPFIKVGETTETIQQTYDKVIVALKENSFSVIGGYNPAGKSYLKVIAFTRSDLKNTVIKVKDRGALAAVYKVGLVKKNGKVTITYTNPEFVLRAYLQGNYNTYKTTFTKFSNDLKTALSGLGNDFIPFGGSIKTSKLKNYHYMMSMPYFSDPITLKKFNSFEEGLKTIKANLKAGKGSTKQIYKLVYKSKKVAVFGVGLKSKTDGEPHFLPIIGETHAAALPYEIILQGNKATMLHGKYRIALYWPELTMGTFMKIISTPGNIEDTLQGLCE